MNKYEKSYYEKAWDNRMNGKAQVSTKEYKDGWDRIFGKKTTESENKKVVKENTDVGPTETTNSESSGCVDSDCKGTGV